MSEKRRIGLLGTVGLTIGAAAAVSGLLLRRWAKSGSGELRFETAKGKAVTLRKLPNGSIVIEPSVPAAEEEPVGEESVIVLDESDIAAEGTEDAAPAEPADPETEPAGEEA